MAGIVKVSDDYFSSLEKSKETWKNREVETINAETEEIYDLNEETGSSYESKKNKLIKLFEQRKNMQEKGVRSGAEYKANGEAIKQLREKIKDDLQKEIDSYEQEINKLRDSAKSDINDSIIDTNQAELDNLNQLLNSKISGFYVGRQNYEDATDKQKQIVDIINNPNIYKDTRANYCQAYVNDVFQAAGIIDPNSRYDCATEACWGTGETVSTDLENIPVGACLFSDRSNPPVACGDHDAGHVAIYIGDGKVIHNVGGIQTISVDDWISQWSVDGRKVTWGWINGEDLSV